MNPNQFFVLCSAIAGILAIIANELGKDRARWGLSFVSIMCALWAIEAML